MDQFFEWYYFRKIFVYIVYELYLTIFYFKNNFIFHTQHLKKCYKKNIKK